MGEGWNGLKELNWRCGPELEGPELFNENGKNVLGEVLEGKGLESIECG